MVHTKYINKPGLEFTADSIAVELFAIGLLFVELEWFCGSWV